MSVDDLTYTFISAFVALFPVFNPIGSGFITNSFLNELDDDQRKIAIKKIIYNFLLIGIGSLVIGHLLLLLFNLAIPVIQLGGGILICKTAIEWLSESGSSNAQQTNSKEISKINIEDIEKKIFYPITFPICIGPGSISVIFTLMAAATSKGNLLATGVKYIIIAVVIGIMSVILYLFLSQGQIIMKRLGNSGNMIINKLVAFFTFCIGIQIVVTGISKIFHINIL